VYKIPHYPFSLLHLVCDSQIKLHNARPEILMAMKIHAIVLWVMTPCSNVIGYRRSWHKLHNVL